MEDSYKHKGLRNKLVKFIEQKGISDKRVLNAIKAVPRHFFFDNAFLQHAYQDKAFPIGEGQTISQPYTVAFQTEKLEVAPGHKVLEIGTGSGYQACVLIEMGANVFTVEYNRVLYDRTKNFLPLMGYSPRFYHGDGSRGLPVFAPYDRIIVTAGAPNVPRDLLDQLTIGGILIIPVGDLETQKMLKIRKRGSNDFEEETFDFFSFVPLKGKEGWGK
ncbi:MAG: protein-L-isoaspartate(D-aspartate) O-methyltransferase [Candidatus Cyclobacteriaceae bacterium M2_1C_046]